MPPIIPGTKEMIADLHAMNMATYVWTGRDKFSGMKVFDGLGLTDLSRHAISRHRSRLLPTPNALS